jgi:hypothetical protein
MKLSYTKLLYPRLVNSHVNTFPSLPPVVAMWPGVFQVDSQHQEKWHVPA